ncbi:MAG: hypothetical protein RL160_1718, partial [Bacteroidota bacterium]
MDMIIYKQRDVLLVPFAKTPCSTSVLQGVFV